MREVTEAEVTELANKIVNLQDELLRLRRILLVRDELDAGDDRAVAERERECEQLEQEFGKHKLRAIRAALEAR
jgi:hypothetical protein